MKKVVIALLLVSLCVGSVFAQVTFSGHFRYGFMMGDGAPAGDLNRIWLNASAVVDDYNTFTLNLRDTRTGDNWDVLNTSARPPLNVHGATLATDWGKLFGLPVGLATTLGYSGFGIGDAYYVTTYGLEILGGIWLDRQGAGQVAVTIADMVTIQAAANFVATELELYAGATIDFAPVALKLGYISKNKSYADGALYAEAKFATDLSDDMDLAVAGSVRFNLHDDKNDATSEVEYGAGVHFGFAALGAGISFRGTKTKDMLLAVDLGYGITDALSVDAVTTFSLNSDTNGDQLWRGFELSASYAFPKVTYSLGYLFAAKQEVAGVDVYYTDAACNAIAVAGKGGFFVALRMTF